ncbi:MAG: hypothetical protein K1000chlam2_00194 [Chlamydiae bacterium]|nr:hypothetical protein [Chlamydiota bacterium]
MTTHYISYQDKTVSIPPIPKFSLSMTSCTRFCCLSTADEKVSQETAKSGLFAMRIATGFASIALNPSICIGGHLFNIACSSWNPSIYSVANIAFSVLSIGVIAKVNENGALTELSHFLWDHSKIAFENVNEIESKNAEYVVFSKPPSIPEPEESGILCWITSKFNTIIFKIHSFFLWIKNQFS